MKIGLKRKVTWTIVLMELVMVAAAVAVSYYAYNQRYTTAYTKLSTNVVSSTIALCDEADLESLKGQVQTIYQGLERGDRIVHSEGSATSDELSAYRERFSAVTSSQAYANVTHVLQTVLDNNDIKYLYVGFFDSETGDFVYLADGTTGEDASYPGDAETESPALVSQILSNGYSVVGFFDDESAFGQLCSTYLPIYDANGNYVCNVAVDMETSNILAERRDFLFSMGLFMLAVMLPLVLLILHLTDAFVVRPIYQINDAVTDFVASKCREDDQGSAGDGEPTEPGGATEVLQATRVSKISELSITTHDELEMLSHSVQEMEGDINAYIDEITTIVGEKERMGAELDIATKIQEGMLPHIFPAFPESPEVDLYASMDPAKEVGGDFYDFFRIDETHIGIVMGDVSGKGIPGALFMMISKTLIKDAVQRSLSPKAALEAVNDQLCENNEAGMFVTVWLGVLDLSTGRLLYVNAGHEYPAIRHEDGQFELQEEKHDMVVGGLEGISYHEHEGSLVPGDILFLYTDGVPEATDSAVQMYGTKRMLDALDNVPGVDLAELLSAVKRDVDSFVMDAPQFDDLTMLAVLYKGPASAD